MQSHPDTLHSNFEELKKEAKRLTEEQSNVITAGNFGEQVLFEHQTDNELLRRLPDDPLCLRVSIGSVKEMPGGDYLVFRGDPEKIKALLVRSLNLFRRHFS